MHLFDLKKCRNFTTPRCPHAVNQRESWSSKARLSKNNKRRLHHPFAFFAKEPGAPSFRALAKGWERCCRRQPSPYADDAIIVPWPITSSTSRKPGAPSFAKGWERCCWGQPFAT